MAKLIRAVTRWLKPLYQSSFRIFQFLSEKWDFDKLNTYIKLYHLNYPKMKEPETLVATLSNSVPKTRLSLIGTTLIRFFGDFWVKEQFYFCNPYTVVLSSKACHEPPRWLLSPLFEGMSIYLHARYLM